MSIVIISIFSFLIIFGLLMQMGSLTKYLKYSVTEGEVVKGLMCIPCLDEAVEMEEGESIEPSMVMIEYRVNGEVYHLNTNDQKAFRNFQEAEKVRVYYNPHNPEDSRLREGTPYLGAMLMGFSLVGLAIWLLL